jgi:hypothetical protein
MARQIAAVLVGMLLCVLLTAAGGFLQYRLSSIWPEHTLGAIARYLGNPLVALIVGAVVGALAKIRAPLLALLSLTPMVVGTLTFIRRLNFFHTLFMVFFMIANLAIGMVVAAFVAKNRARSRVLIAN